MEKVIINDVEGFEEKKKKILEAGVSKFHVLADFDLTLTKANLDGIKTQSIMKYLRNGDYLTPEYAKRSHELFNEYYPYEIDINLSLTEKMEKMKEWWVTHFELLKKTGLDKKTLEKFVQDVKLEFRDGAKEFLEFLDKNNIPLVIISSSGLGSVIPMYLKREGLMYGNISVVANLFEFNEKGIMTKVKEPIIHCMNKSEITLNSLPIYSELEKRKNVLLLGDGLGDLGMIEGFNYENLLTVGFLNENIEENKEVYKKSFDVVIPDDGSFEFINEFLKEFR